MSRSLKNTAPPAGTERRTYRVEEFMAAYRVGRSKTYELIRSGRLKSIKLGFTRLIDADSAADLMKGDAA